MFKLGLKNYRGFLNEEFVFSRINILIGENSAGKTSVFKFLLALKQSLRIPNNRDSNLTFSGIDTDLGNYRETIYNHEVKRNLSFYFEFSDDYFPFFFSQFFAIPFDREEVSSKAAISEQRKKIVEILGGEINEPTKISFELSKDLSRHDNIKMIISNKNIGFIEVFHNESSDLPEQEIYLINDDPTCSMLFVTMGEEYLFEGIVYEKQGFLSIVSSGSLRESIESKLEHENLGKNRKSIVESIYWRMAYLLVTQNYIQNQLSGIEYVNPLLSKPAARIYLEGDKKNIRRVGNIEDVVEFLSANNTQFAEKLSSALEDFGIANRVYVKSTGFARQLRVVVNGVDSNIKDVGFGVSLQIPIFIQAILSDGAIKTRNGKVGVRGETLLIEQPEVHLHPRLQAKFIDALLQISSRNRYIIETHSEHIIRMLQIIVKEKRYGIKSSDVSITYLRKEKKKMVKSFHSIDSESGKLKPLFPKGFYDVSYNLAFELMS